MKIVKKKKRINSKDKGKRGERMFAAYLNENCKHADARRGQQFQGGPESPVVVSSLPYHFEVKFRENLNVHKAMEQARKEAPPEKTPNVQWKKSREDWLTILLTDDFLKIVNRKDTAAC